jgi:hypothetical protein
VHGYVHGYVHGGLGYAHGGYRIVILSYRYLIVSPGGYLIVSYHLARRLFYRVSTCTYRGAGSIALRVYRVTVRVVTSLQLIKYLLSVRPSHRQQTNLILRVYE